MSGPNGLFQSSTVNFLYFNQFISDYYRRIVLSSNGNILCQSITMGGQDLKTYIDNHSGSQGPAGTIEVGSVSSVPFGTSPAVTNVGTASAAILNFVLATGPQGIQGGPGTAASIAVGSVSTVPFGDGSTVVNVGSSSAAIFNFELESGEQGDPGAAATITIGDVDTVPYGSGSSVVNSGTSLAAVLDFTLENGEQGPQGIPGSAATIAVGSVSTVPFGEGSTVVNVGSSSAAIFNFELESGEQGDPGTAASIVIGDVDTVPYGSGSSVVNSGTSLDAVLDFTLEGGRAATVTVGSVTTVDYGTGCNVVNVGTTSDAILNFTLAQGREGPEGPRGHTGSTDITAVSIAVFASFMATLGLAVISASAWSSLQGQVAGLATDVGILNEEILALTARIEVLENKCHSINWSLGTTTIDSNVAIVNGTFEMDVTTPSPETVLYIDTSGHINADSITVGDVLTDSIEVTGEITADNIIADTARVKTHLLMKDDNLISVSILEVEGTTVLGGPVYSRDTSGPNPTSGYNQYSVYS